MAVSNYTPSAAMPAFRDGFTRTDGLPVVPIVLGIVGHRRILDGQREALRASVSSILRDFRKAYPRTPLIVLTALAEGADQIAAEAALAVEGTFVRAPLPFAPDVYRASTSFDSDEEGEEGRQTLDRLLRNKARVESFVVSLPGDLARELEQAGPLRVATEEHDEALRVLRHACYANAGGYITRHCHLLIALWDGHAADPKRPSGTGEYVALKLFGQAPAQYPWADSYPLGFLGERGLVMVVQTPQFSFRRFGGRSRAARRVKFPPANRS